MIIQMIEAWLGDKRYAMGNFTQVIEHLNVVMSRFDGIFLQFTYGTAIP